MCGISAILDRRGSAGVLPALLRMHAQIRHRGPDGDGFLTVGIDGSASRVADSARLSPEVTRAAIAFRRLNVIDLSDAASQPMRSADGAVWIAFNGEIYNFRPLRGLLESEGIRFRTSSDTEVALAAFEKWGTGCFDRLDGMWAMVILDLRRRALFLSRDRFGIKPLHWAIDGERLLVSSEIKQILAATGTKPVANARAVRSFLQGRRVPALDDTFFQSIHPLPPATFAAISLDDGPLEPKPQAYWSFSSIESREMSEREYPAMLERFEAAVESAVDTHMVADVQVGFLLSGGLDSSTLTALMSDRARKRGERPAPTFSFGFRERAPHVCEMPYVDSIVRKLGLANHETSFDERWVLENAGRVMHALEEPILALAGLAQYRIFEFCRAQGMTVVVDGEGSDEILGGYTYHQRDLLIDRATHGRLLSFGSELRAISSRRGVPVAGIVNEFFVAPLRRRRKVSFPWIDNAYASSNGSAAARVLADGGGHASRVNRRLFYDVRWGNAKVVLGYTDRMSMAHSIEARVPYFDLELIKLAFSLPDHFKVGRGERKRILRDVARRHLPPDVTERRDRMGFGTPDGQMIRGALWPAIAARITDPSIAASGLFVPAELERLIRGFETGAHDDFRAIWRIYALALWADAFSVSFF